MTWTQQDYINKEPTDYMKAQMRRLIWYQAEGLSDTEIAKKLGYKNRRSLTLIRQSKWFWAEAERLEPKLPRPVRRKKFIGTAEQREIRQMHEHGLNNRQIAKAMPEWSKRTIDKHIKKMGIKSKCQANLTDEEKATIVKLHDQGMSQRKIAEIIGRGKTAVGNFCLKHFGKHRYVPTKFERLKKQFSINK